MHLIKIVLCLYFCHRFVRCALFFPSNTAYGIFVAIAVPLDLPHRNVFISYNFEANYNLPRTWGIPPILKILAAIAVPLDLPHRNVFFSYNFEANYNLPATWGIPPVVDGIEDEDFFQHEMRQLQECSNCTTTTTTEASSPTTTTTEDPPTTRKSKIKSKPEEREKRSLLTRSHFYHILKDKFQRSGYNGEPCLLRLICETNASSLGDINGVLGSLIHILFSPTTSMKESLPLSYYQAEVDGAHDHCDHYATECPESILDLISSPLHEIIENLVNKNIL